MTTKKIMETCSLCKRVGEHARRCPNWQCPSCGLIGGKHNDDCWITRDAIKPARMEPLNGKSHFDGETFSCNDLDMLVSDGVTMTAKTVNIPKKGKKP